MTFEYLLEMFHCVGISHYLQGWRILRGWGDACFVPGIQGGLCILYQATKGVVPLQMIFVHIEQAIKSFLNE